MGEAKESQSMMRRAMHALAKMMPANDQGGNPAAVRMFKRMQTLGDAMIAGPLRRGLMRAQGKTVWPVAKGAYVLGNADSPVAICTLTNTDLCQPLAALPGVAIAGRVYTPNLGIEKIIQNTTANPSIRFLVLCGKESSIFHPAQAIRALFDNGMDGERRIIGAIGPMPVLSNVSAERIASFRQQVELGNMTGEMNVRAVDAVVHDLAARNPGRFTHPIDSGTLPIVSTQTDGSHDSRFTVIRPGGHRESLEYDPKGFFVITVDRDAHKMVVRHYAPDNTPRHVMRGHNAEAMLLGLLHEGLVSQHSHAGYLGKELAKAEAALKLDLRYEQDQPLRKE